jgi:glycosyltransferase involved in cell wall biosynthesis
MSRAGKIKVLLVAPGSPMVGGQAVQAQRLLDKFRHVEELEVGFLPINPVFISSLQKIKYVRTVLTSVRYILSLFLTIPKYDVIHVFSASFASFILAPTPAILIAKLFGKKVLLNYRSGFLSQHLEEWPRTSLPIMRRCDEIVTPSRYLVDVFEKFGVKAKPVFNFVGTEKYKFRRREHFEPKFLSNRNFEDLYNVACTIDAFARIQAEYPRASLVIAGDGPLRDELTAKVAKLNLRNVEFVGQVSQDVMADLYDQADIYLNSPNIDNMPNSILEAFASGTAVVSTNAGGIPYIVENGSNGVLVETGDDLALAEAALGLMNEPGLARSMILSGRAEIKKYEWESVRSDWLDVYRELVN